MKIFAIILCAVVAVASAQRNSASSILIPEDTCHVNIKSFCEKKTNSAKLTDINCNSRIPQFAHSEKGLNAFFKEQLDISYHYLLLATQFGTYVMDRPGFQSKFRALSDRSFEKGIDLAKYITKRGGEVTFEKVNLTQHSLEISELEAMALTAKTEKKLFEDARMVHEVASHAHNQRNYDPELAHYIEEEYLGDLANSVRKFTGYTNDLVNLYRNSKDTNMDTYLFDKYLQDA